MANYHELVENQRAYVLSGQPASLTHRRNQLLKLRKVLSDEQDTLTEAVFKDLRRQKELTGAIELSGVFLEIDYMLDNMKEWSSPTNVEKTLLTLLDTPQIVRNPKGVVLVVGPWNYPLNTLFVPLVAVLAAGNTAVVKPSEVASHTAQAVDRILSKAFDKYLAVVQGGITETTELMKEHFDHIMFTGSAPVARFVLEAAAKHLTPCTLELGGKCPVVVEADADIEVTARRLAWGKWLNCGQTCLAPDYVIVNSAVKNELVDALIRNLQTFYGKDVQNSPDYSRIINTRHFDRISNMLVKTKASKLFSGGDADRNDCFIPPTILNAQTDDIIMEDEIFGPILPIVAVGNVSEAIDLIRRHDRPLAIYLFTRDEEKVQRILRETISGSVTVNDVVIQLTVDTLPFGGIGKSGMGRYRGKFGFDEFTHEKAVLKRGFFGDGLFSARYPPLTEKKVAQLSQLTSSRRGIPKWFRSGIGYLPCLVIGMFVGFLVNRFSKTRFF